MFALIRQDRVERLLNPADDFLLDDVRYPAGWLSAVDDRARASLGIVPVEEEAEPDAFWFVLGKRHPVFIDGKVLLRWEKVSRPLAELKAACFSKLRSETHAILAPTDWLVVRASEGGAPLPEKFMAWRQRIRDEKARVEHLVAKSRDGVEMMVAMNGLTWPKSPDNS